MAIEFFFLALAGIKRRLFSVGGNGTLLLDACLLTCELAQIVKLGTTYLTTLVHLDAVDARRINGEDTLHTHGSRHLAHSEALLVSMT